MRVLAEIPLWSSAASREDEEEGPTLDRTQVRPHGPLIPELHPWVERND